MPLAPLPPPLAQSLRILEPDVVDRLVLRICLGDHPAVREAWARWSAERIDLRAVLRARPLLRRLLPLFHGSVCANHIPAGEDTLSLLRAAAVWENRRAEHIRDLLGTILAVLEGAGLAALVLKGAALAHTAYPRPCLRHCHDIDLLLDAALLPDAQAALATAGFHPKADAVSAGPPVLVHGDGLPVTLHTRLWASGSSMGSWSGLRPHARRLPLAGCTALLLPPMINLLHVCTHAGMTHGAGNWTWMADAAALVTRAPLEPGDLAALATLARAERVAFLLAIRLHMLAQVGVSVPPAIGQTLDAVIRDDFSRQSKAARIAVRRLTAWPSACVLERMRRTIRRRLEEMSLWR